MSEIHNKIHLTIRGENLIIQSTISLIKIRNKIMNNSKHNIERKWNELRFLLNKNLKQ